MENADLETLINIDEIGEKIARSILNYFANESNRKLVGRLKTAGLQLYRPEEDLSGHTDKLAGQSIVISGVFTYHQEMNTRILSKNTVARTWEASLLKPVLFWPETIWDLRN